MRKVIKMETEIKFEFIESVIEITISKNSIFEVFIGRLGQNEPLTEFVKSCS